MPSFMPHTEAYARMFSNGTDQDRAVLGEMHLHWEGEIRRIVATGVDHRSIAYTLHLEIDQSVAQTLKTKNGRKVQCKRGCAACCKLHVSITHAEAALLLMAADDKGIALDWSKLERQAEHRLATWQDMSPGDRRCVFLNSRNECGVYEHRPAACRKYLVASDPKGCDTVKHPGGDIAVIVPPEGEAIASAMLGILDWGSMPRMLLAAAAEAAPQPEGAPR